MEETTPTQNPPTTSQERPEAQPQPAPGTDRHFRAQLSRTGTPGFRIALAIGAIVLLVAGIFIYRYLGSYESTDDAQVDGHINSMSARVSGHVVKLNVEDNQA